MHLYIPIFKDFNHMLKDVVPMFPAEWVYVGPLCGKKGIGKWG